VNELVYSLIYAVRVNATACGRLNIEPLEVYR